MSRSFLQRLRQGRIVASLPYSNKFEVILPSRIATETSLVIRPRSSAPSPLLMWYHGHTELAETLLTNLYTDTNGAVWRALADLGWTIVATDGHGNNWGNQNVIDDGKELYAAAVSNYSIDTTKVAFMGQSMGGLASLLLAIDGTIPVKAIAMSDAVSSLFYMMFGVSGSGSTTYSGPIRTAYGIAADNSDYAAKTVGHDPMEYAASAFPQIHYKFWCHSNDTAVYRSRNSDPMNTKLSGRALSTSVDGAGSGHGSNPTFNAATWSSSIVDFLATSVGA